MRSEYLWRRTHRQGAWVFVIDGIQFVLSGALPDGPILAVLMAAFLLFVAYLFLYSYLAWRDVRRVSDSRAKGVPAFIWGSW